MRSSIEILFFTVLALIEIGEIAAQLRNTTESSPPKNFLEEPIDTGNSSPNSEWKNDGSLCAHKDYRTYIKCLLRHRRYDSPHATVEIRSPAVGSSTCVEECEQESCRRQNRNSCADLCYERCLKKTKEIHHTITEYETGCDDGDDCDRAGKPGSFREPSIPLANLTTSIDIRNYVNNTNVVFTGGRQEHRDNDDEEGEKKIDSEEKERKDGKTKCRKGDAGCSDTGVEDGDKKEGAVVQPRLPPTPGFQPWYPSPSLSLIPQIQMVPQVTFGLGINPGLGFGSFGGTGCPYASIWLCIPQQGQQQIPDCSGCQRATPSMRSRCDPSC